MLDMSVLIDLLNSASIPVHGAGVNQDGTVRIDFKESATTAQRSQAETILQSYLSMSENPPVFFGAVVLSGKQVDRITIQRIQNHIRPDGDETLKLNAELREMKIAVYALMKFINAVIVPGLTTAQKTALAPLLNQINTSIALTDEVIVIRDEGTAFKTANNL